MATKPRNFDIRFFYHIYNCGVNKNTIFFERNNYIRFLETLEYYLNDQLLSYAQFKNLTFIQQQLYLREHPKTAKTQRVKLIAYCLMPNHFHFLMRPVRDNGVTVYVADTSNSYTKYINSKNHRIGNLFQGPFKAKEVATEASLYQVSRYIHLNPVMASHSVKRGGSKLPGAFEYSSYYNWIHPARSTLLDYEEIYSWLNNFGGAQKYKEFVEARAEIPEPFFGIEDLTPEYFKP